MEDSASPTTSLSSSTACAAPRSRVGFNQGIGAIHSPARHFGQDLATGNGSQLRQKKHPGLDCIATCARCACEWVWVDGWVGGWAGGRAGRRVHVHVVGRGGTGGVQRLHGMEAKCGLSALTFQERGPNRLMARDPRCSQGPRRPLARPWAWAAAGAAGGAAGS